MNTNDSFSQGIQVNNLIFMSPDYETETFKNDYHELQNVITVTSAYFISIARRLQSMLITEMKQ